MTLGSNHFEPQVYNLIKLDKCLLGDDACGLVVSDNIFKTFAI